MTYECQGRWVVPEKVVVLRCRHAGHKTLRLPPSIWRTLGRIEESERRVPDASLADVIQQVDIGKSKRPSVALVEALRGAVRPDRLRALVRRHTGGEADPSRPGVPDLFVYRQRSDGRPYAAKFVEVKRPGEDLSSHQRAEIRFMRALGLKAGVLRLIERPARPAAVEPGENR